MKYLLDTHVFLWWCGEDPRLSPAARKAIASGENQLYVSVASAWEMAVKIQLGRLTVSGELDGFLAEHTRRNAMDILPIGLAHAVRIQSLPLHHRDPFDRMLLAQAAEERLVLITGDHQLASYGVPILW